MAVKLVAFDMDGTMLTSEKETPPGIEAEIRRLHEKGIVCAAATGRFYGTVRELFPSCDDCLSCIGCNGHEICHDGEVLSRLHFEPETVLETVRLVRQLGDVIPVLFTATSGQAVLAPHQTWGELPAGEYGEVRLCKEPDLSEPIVKVSLFSENGAGHTERHMNAHAGELGQDVLWVPTSPWTVDGCLDGMGKGKGLALLAEKLGIHLDETLAFGDHMNDIEMLQVAGEGVAMGNALPEVKAVADRVTWTNDEYGVLRELQCL